MRRTITASLLGLSLCLTGCNFLKDFIEHPRFVSQRVMSIVEVVLNTSQIIFQTIKPTLPLQDQAKAQAAFDAAVLTVLDTMRALDAGIGTIEAVIKAADSIKVLIDSLQAQANAYAVAQGKPIPMAVGRDQLTVQIEHLHSLAK